MKPPLLPNAAEQRLTCPLVMRDVLPPPWKTRGLMRMKGVPRGYIVLSRNVPVPTQFLPCLSFPSLSRNGATAKHSPKERRTRSRGIHFARNTGHAGNRTRGTHHPRARFILRCLKLVDPRHGRANHHQSSLEIRYRDAKPVGDDFEVGNRDHPVGMLHTSFPAPATCSQMLLHAPQVRSAVGLGEFAGQQRRHEFLDLSLWAGAVLIKFRKGPRSRMGIRLWCTQNSAAASASRFGHVQTSPGMPPTAPSSRQARVLDGFALGLFG